MSTLDKVGAYLKDYLALQGISGYYAPLLRELIESKNQDGYILVNSALKRLLSERLDVAVGSIENALTKFVDKEVLIRVDRGMYIIGRDIIDISGLKNREDPQIRLHYSDKGREIKSIKVIKK